MDSKTPNSSVAAASHKDKQDHVLITRVPHTGADFIVHFDEFVARPSAYRELTQQLFTATPADTFVFYFNGPGGQLDSCIQLIHAIANTPAKVVGHLLGEVNSAHSNLFMACHDHVVYPYALMMVHTFSGGFYGKGEDTGRASAAYNALTKKVYSELYEGFLTEQELADVLENNKDLYFHGEDIADRLEGVYAIRKAMCEQEEVEQRQALKETLQGLVGEENEQVRKDESEAL